MSLTGSRYIGFVCEIVKEPTNPIIGRWRPQWKGNVGSQRIPMSDMGGSGGWAGTTSSLSSEKETKVNFMKVV